MMLPSALRQILGIGDVEVAVTPAQPPPKVPKPTLDETIDLLRRCVQHTHFSPLYYGDPELYNAIWSLLGRWRVSP